MHQEPPVDLVAVIIALFATVTSPQTAAIFGPYVAIVMMSFAGSIAHVCATNTETRMDGFKQLMLRAFLAFTVTVSLALLIERFFPMLQARYTISPIAFLIGYVRDYRAFAVWVFEFAKKRGQP